MNKLVIQNQTNELLKKFAKPGEFTKGLQELLKLHVDEEATKNYRRIIPERGKFYGVPKPILRVIASEIGKFIQKEPGEAEETLHAIWSEGSFEAKQITAKSLEKFGPKNPNSCLGFISSVLSDLDNWSVCDCLAMYGVRPIVLSNPKAVLPLSEKWIMSHAKWIRRFGVVTLLGYKKIIVTEEVFGLLDLVMEDRDRDIKMAVAWILRDISKKNPAEVAQFLIKWARSNPNNDTKWVIKNGLKKLSQDEQKRLLELLV